MNTTNHIKLFEEYASSLVLEMDMNDPILILARANKDKSKRDKEELAKRLAKRVYGRKREELEIKLEEINEEIADLFKLKSQTFEDQEAEDGGKSEDWNDDDANEYGTILNDIDEKLEKFLTQRKEIETKLAY